LGFEDLGLEDLGLEDVDFRNVGFLALVLASFAAFLGADAARVLFGRGERMILAMISRILTRHDDRQRF
jgi:hypothetical protein